MRKRLSATLIVAATFLALPGFSQIGGTGSIQGVGGKTARRCARKNSRAPSRSGYGTTCASRARRAT